MKKIVALLALFPLIAFADIGPQPTYVHRLHRVGYETLVAEGDLSSAMTYAGIGVAVCAALLGVLIVLLVRTEQGKKLVRCTSVARQFIERHAKLTGCLLSVLILVVAVYGIYSWGRKIMSEFGLDPAPVVHVEETGWKYEDAVGASEREALMERVRNLKDELQEAVNESGIEVWHAQHWQERAGERRDKIAAVETVLAENDELRVKCKGIPIEYMIDELVFGLYAQNLRRFERWARAQSPNLSESENTVLFRWQRFVCRKERRDWKRKFADDEFMRPGRATARPMPCAPFGLDDFVDKTSDGVAFVRYWHEKAESLGFKMQDVDRDLFARASRQRPQLSEKVKVTTRHLSVTGVQSEAEIEAFADYWKDDGLGRPMDLSSLNRVRLSLNEVVHRTEATVKEGANLWVVVLDGVDNATLRAVCETGSERVGTLELKSPVGTSCDLTPLAGLPNLHELRMTNCFVVTVGALSKTRLRKFVAEDSELGCLSFLLRCTELNEVSLKGCSFSGLENLRDLSCLCDLNLENSRETVDLSVVKTLGCLGGLNVSGCCVTNFAALRAHPSLHVLKMRHMKGGVDSLSVLSGNEELLEVDFIKTDFAPSVYADFARSFRRKKYADAPKRLLEEAVRDRDLEEVRRLCVADVLAGADIYSLPDGSLNTDDAVSNFAIAYDSRSAEVDLEMFRILIGKASKKTLDERLLRDVKSFGDEGASDRDVPCQTIRLAALQALLDGGADPNARDFFRRTVLAVAITESKGTECVGLVKLLLGKGADPKLPEQGHFGKSLLEELVSQGLDEDRVAILRLLLVNGAEVKGKKLLETIHQWKFGQGKLELVKELVEKGAVVTDLAIGSAWKDEEIRKYLLQQVGKSESDYEVTVREDGFSIRSTRRAPCANRERSERDFRQRQEERRFKVEARHREAMERMREHRGHRRQFEEMLCQHDESECLRQLDAIRRHVERERQEILGSVPPAKRDAFAKWLEERRREEESRWAELRQRVVRSREEAQGRTDKANADIRTRQEEMRNQVLRNEREQIRRQREGGAPEWVHREHELHLRRMEMHHEIARERDLGTTYLNYGPGMDMRSAVNEYRNWLDRRICEEKERASSESSSGVPYRWK